MWRTASVCLALLLLTWIEFCYFPGHTYLGSATQLYVPMLEHLGSPAFLTRDLVATHPNLAYTLYDEVTLSLMRAGKLDFARALAAQQIACRLAGIWGVYLLARSAGARRPWSVLISAFVNAGLFLPGLNIWLIDPDPVPRAFAFGLTVFALGLLARERVLLSGLAAGAALLFDPVISGPYWICVLTIALADKTLRRPLRPLAPILMVFVLLLANLAQLQPGTPDAQPVFEKIPPAIGTIQQFRSPELWLSLWPRKFIYLYLAIFVIGVWALRRIWTPSSRRLPIWVFVLVPALSIAALPVSFVLLDKLRWSAMPRFRVLELLTYLVVFAWTACGVTAARALAFRALREAAAWATVTVLFLAPIGPLRTRSPKIPAGIHELASWAENYTWGSSVFLFPDAGHALYPGMFRAESQRALWIDWESGRQINYTMALAPDWFARWQQTMEQPLSAARLTKMLALPIDYVVLRNQFSLGAVLEGRTVPVQPEFSNREFRVYETSTLRLLPGKLIIR